jgi:hypothetical protein
MLNSLRRLTLGLGRVNGRHMRLFLIILSLLMFVIGAGAPGDHGGWGG